MQIHYLGGLADVVRDGVVAAYRFDPAPAHGDGLGLRLQWIQGCYNGITQDEIGGGKTGWKTWHWRV
ncbi:MAG: hypothetical protein ABI287_10760 [Rhodanobacter sp.]